MPTRKSPGRPGIVVSSEAPLWGSCKIITPNLERAYRNAFGTEADYFSLTSTMSPSDIWFLAESIYKAQPDRLVFLDHMPHPKSLLQALEQLYGRKALPPLYVHVYGDFTLYSKHWLEVEDLLRKTRVEFICASHRQANLVSKFMAEPADVVQYCPFPVDGKVYRHDPAERKRRRAELGLHDGELAVLYTGRISLQKNSIRLVSEFVDLSDRLEKQGRKARLLLAGSFDDLGAPFFGVDLRKGFYYQHWCSYVEGLSPSQRERIQYLGNFGAKTLKGLYNAADLYFSLSLHHDEDYGMSPAEALCCGTPCTLSSWGGYASFVLPGEQDPIVRDSVLLAPVSLSVDGVSIEQGAVQKCLLAQSKADQSEAARKRRSEAYLGWVSIEAAEKRIRKFHERLPRPFQGFNWLMRRHAESISGPIMFPAGPKKGTFYEEIYGAYIQG